MKKVISKLLVICAVVICCTVFSKHAVEASEKISIRAAYYYLNEAGNTIQKEVTIDNVDTDLTFVEFYEKHMKPGIADLKDLKTPSYWCEHPIPGSEDRGWDHNEGKIFQANYTVDYFAVYPGYTWSSYGFETVVVPNEVYLDSGIGFMCCMPDGASDEQVRSTIYAAAQNCYWIKAEIDCYGKYDTYLYSEGSEWSFPYYVLSIDATSAGISSSKKKLYTGQKNFQLSLVNVPEYNKEDGSYKVSWESSNPKIASVDENGVVTAKKKGEATITGRCEGVSFTCAVTVAAPYISKTKAELKVKKSLKLKVYGTEVKSWKTSDASIAKVSKDGKVTALKAGKVTIKAKCSNGKTYSCSLTVTK